MRLIAEIQPLDRVQAPPPTIHQPFAVASAARQNRPLCGHPTGLEFRAQNNWTAWLIRWSARSRTVRIRSLALAAPVSECYSLEARRTRQFASVAFARRSCSIAALRIH